MNKVFKKVAAMTAAVMMMSTMAMSASALTASNSKNKLVYSGSLTTNNYYVTYSNGTNKTSKKRYLYVSSIVMKKKNKTTYSILTSNASEGVAKANTSRYCYANIGSSEVARSYHRSLVFSTTVPTEGIFNTLAKNIYY